MATVKAPLRLLVFYAITAILGLAVAAASWAYSPPPELVGVLLFSVLGVATNLSKIPTAGDTTVSLADAVFLAASITLGPPAAVLAIVVSITAGTIADRRPAPWSTMPRRLLGVLHNYGMYMLMVVAGTWLYMRLGGQLNMHRLNWTSYLAAFGFILVYETVNRLILYISVALRGRPLWPVLQSEPEDLSLEVLSLHVGILIALLYSTNGFGPLVILGAFLFLIGLLLRRRVEGLQQRVTQLGALNEIGRAISATVDIPRLMEAIYRESSKVIDTTNFYIALYTPENDEVTFVLDVTEDKPNPVADVQRGGQGLTEYVIRTRQPLLLEDKVPERTLALGMTVVGQPAQCWIGVPMIASDCVVGMIAAQSYKQTRQFRPEHVDLLMTIAAQAAIAIQNARLLEQIGQQERLRHEFELAQKIQQSLLPQPPQIPGAFIDCCCVPAQETGGDLFDFILIDESHIGIAIGDVMGKGMPAALLMATIRSALRAYAQHQIEPAAVLEAVNRVLYADTRGKSMITLCYLVLDLNTWTFTLANAGHLCPLLCSDGSLPLFMECRGHLPIGLQPSASYTSQSCHLAAGQAMLLYTDGVIEAHNNRREMLGFEALQNMAAGQPAGQIIKAILSSVASFRGDATPEDDQTLVIIQRQTPR